jgi:DNA ligase-associated metallophosphoesterase
MVLYLRLVTIGQVSIPGPARNRRFPSEKAPLLDLDKNHSRMTAMTELTLNQIQLKLLPQKAVYVESLGALLVSDVHLGKSETFQHHGLPVPSLVNHATLQRLEKLCNQFQPKSLWVLGDLFHAKAGMTDEVIDLWLKFLHRTQVNAHLILGNHDRHLKEFLDQLSVECFFEAVAADGLILSHEPHFDSDRTNICGHTHPCLRLNSGCDRLRLPCFHWEAHRNRLTLPSFGEFTGGYDVELGKGDMAYVVAEDQVVEFDG